MEPVAGFPLSGFRVIELSTYVAAPSCARMLGDWGASVIKVEPLTGDIYRKLGVSQGIPTEQGYSPSFDNENANKRYLSLNLKTPEGMAVLHRLIAKSDVLITNYRVEALKKMGLDYETLSEKYPGLVFASIMGYGAKGPDRDRPGFDFTAFYARSGFMADLSHKDAPLLNPVSGFGDHLAGLGLAGGIAAALLKRERTGLGDKVEVGLYQTGIYAFGCSLLSTYYGREYPKVRGLGANPLVTSYRCADGEWIFVSATDFAGQWGKICREVLGHPELAEDPRFWPQKNMIANCAEAVRLLDEIFATKTTKEWQALLIKADVAHEIVQHWKDVLQDEQAWANDYLREVAYDNGKKAVFPNTPINFASQPEKPFQLSRGVGADTEGILKELGYSQPEIDALAAAEKIRR